MTDLVAEKLKLLPDSPGVYIMKDARGKIIYVGKAIVLKNRVRQYFQSSRNQAPKVRAMVSHVADFETIMTTNEVESLILEANLIKKHRPRYNIRLKDDKSYPYVKVTVQEEYPRVFITRRVLRDGARYFGPYTNVTALRDSLKLLKRLFPLRTCRTMPERPCLEYHIKRCLAPCCEPVDKEEYGAMIREVCLFLEGRTEQVEKELPFYLRFSKLPIVKAKVGPKVLALMADPNVYEVLPVKKEVKCAVSGIYIRSIKSVRGGVVPEAPKKKGFFANLRKKAEDAVKKQQAKK